MLVMYSERTTLGRLSRGFGARISTQQLLPYGTAEQVKAGARRLIAEVGCGGGHIIAPTHDIPKDVSPENMAALIEVLQDQ